MTSSYSFFPPSVEFLYVRRMIQEAELGKRIQQQLYSDWKLCQAFFHLFGLESFHPGNKWMARLRENITYLRVMAFSGQISWQQKQTMQISGFTRGIRSIMDRADTGHWSMQVPQPVHNSGSAWGRKIALL